MTQRSPSLASPPSPEPGELPRRPRRDLPPTAHHGVGGGASGCYCRCSGSPGDSGPCGDQTTAETRAWRATTSTDTR